MILAPDVFFRKTPRIIAIVLKPPRSFYVQTRLKMEQIMIKWNLGAFCCWSESEGAIFNVRFWGLDFLFPSDWLRRSAIKVSSFAWWSTEKKRYRIEIIMMICRDSWILSMLFLQRFFDRFPLQRLFFSGDLFQCLWDREIYRKNCFCGVSKLLSLANNSSQIFFPSLWRKHVWLMVVALSIN